VNKLYYGDNLDVLRAKAERSGRSTRTARPPGRTCARFEGVGVELRYSSAGVIHSALPLSPESLPAIGG
jgi:hypothetical protein